MEKISKFQSLKMEFSIIPSIPENMNEWNQKQQWAIVSFEKILENWLNGES